MSKRKGKGVTKAAGSDTFPPKKGAGQPTLYRPEYCATVRKLGKDGKTITQMAAEIGVNRRTFVNWREDHPEFAEALDDAVEAAQAWWEEQGAKGIWGGKAWRDATWIFIMKNRFKDPDHGYRDEQQVDMKGDGWAAFLSAVHAGKVPIPPDPHKDGAK